MKWGKLVAIDLGNCNKEYIKSKSKIKQFIKELCQKIDMERVGKTRIKKFGKGELKGYSAIQFIQTSSITIHLDEENNRAFIDIFSCKEFNSKKAEKFSKKFFKATDSKIRIFQRE